MIGKDFRGRIDEFRFWKKALDETAYLSEDETVKGYLLWDNTVNKYHPEYSSLLLYYKFDQNLCDNIVDYTFRHHGIMNGATRELVADNPLFKYRIVTAYAELSRFTDVGTDRAKYLLCNDLVLMGASLGEDGSAGVSLPFNRGTLSGGASYLDEYHGRKGVLSLDGTGKMNVGTVAMNASDTYTFCTWFYVDEWVEDAYLFRKEKGEDTGLSLRLGVEANAEVVLRVNGSEYRYKLAGELVKEKWIHLGFSTNNMQGATGKSTFRFACNKNKSKTTPYSFPETPQSWKLPLAELSGTEAVIGENFKGKIDETMLWNKASGREDIFKFGEKGADMPGFGKNVGTDYAFYVDSYWKYDNQEDPGYDYFSLKEYLSIMRSAYDGYRGYKMRICVTGGDSWQKTIADASKRERFATEMAAYINSQDDIDGVDIDWEWAEYNGQGAIWTNYGKTMELLRNKLKPGKILTVTPHSVSYWFPKENMKSVDYFLFQNYGPAKDHFTYESFPIAYNNFLAWGYPAEKIVMSFASTTSGKYDSAGNRISPPIRIYQLGDIGPDDNMHDNYYFTGVNQTRWRSEQVKKQDLGGIMCWSLPCDFPSTENPLSLFRASSLAIASNVDTLITKVDLKPTSIEKVTDETAGELILYPNPAKEYISWNSMENATSFSVLIFDMKGQCVLNKKENGNSVSLNGLSDGMYSIVVQPNTGKSMKGMFVKI